MKTQTSHIKNRPDIRNLSWAEILAYIKEIGEKPFRAKQIFDWLYKKHVTSFHDMKNLPVPLNDSLSENFQISLLSILKTLTSRDKTVKILFGLKDEQTLETVYIPTAKRLTVCVSTQVGCKFGCKFCASGVGGFVRNLDCSEILNQILFAYHLFPNRKVTNVVFMGMGEPLDNYDTVLKSIKLINDEKGLNIGARRITVSTCGIVPGIKKLSGEGLQIELAISLHGYDNASRNKLMPVNRRYSFDALMKTAQEYYFKTKRQVTFEYVLIKDFTCTSNAAFHLQKAFKNFDCKMNLIPYNPVNPFSFKAPSEEEIGAFQKALSSKGILSTVRNSRGSDVSASCGQLRSQSK